MKIDNNIVKQLGFFMTESDSNSFSELIKKHLNDILFIDTERSSEKTVKLVPSLSYIKVAGVILNTSIFSLEEYVRLVDAQETAPYSFPMIGKGIIQYLPSLPATYDSNCLKNGRLGASYLTEDIKTADFFRKVLKLIGEGSKKVYLVSRNREILSDIPEKHFVALHYASKEYDGSNEKYLTQSKSRYLVAK
ncbi:hypothetical protein [Pedobacter alluvionis]|uniref:Uncharacterized protein n=1 Tax=Pedobacter alluvionis TaxID=475253 RepID=A0A497XQM4_9SPHI|nr:hypothetical protein [Pedobacter alluvionis]RLJ69180.1 hypothetical protein BCL90_5274 [Pedobacter alluvionis]TFB29729.1 hypothetical protein E3V97_16160 [Pedobacter alluvionis]